MGQISETDNTYTLSTVFREAQCSSKVIKIENRMDCLGIQNHKNPATRTFKKTGTSRDRKKCIFGVPWGCHNYALFYQKSQKSKNRPYGAPGLKNDRPGLKNDRPGLKNDQKTAEKYGF